VERKRTAVLILKQFETNDTTHTNNSIQIVIIITTTPNAVLLKQTNKGEARRAYISTHTDMTSIFNIIL